MTDKRIIHFAIWKNNNRTGKYPVYLCNQAIIPAKDRAIVMKGGDVRKVTCKNCKRQLNNPEVRI